MVGEARVRAPVAAHGTEESRGDVEVGRGIMELSLVATFLPQGSLERATEPPRSSSRQYE